MASEAVAAGIAAAGAVGSTAANVAAQSNLNKKNRAWQEKQATTAFMRQMQMYEEQKKFQREINQYNSVGEQMKRAKAAGLNPNLLYGQLGFANATNSTSFSSAAQAGSPDTKAPDYSGFSSGIAGALAQYQDWQIKNLGMDQARADIANTNANTALRTLEAQRGKFDFDSDKMYKNLERSTQIAVANKSIEKSEAERLLFKAKMQLTQADIAYSWKSMQARLHSLDLSNMQLDNQIGREWLVRQNLEADLGVKASQSWFNNVNAKLGKQQFDFLNPYYQEGYNPNWNVWQLSSVGFNVLQDIANGITNGITGLKNKVKGIFKKK